MGDVAWVSADEGGDEISAFSVRLDSRYNLGNEWEMIVGVVPAGSNVRDGDNCWSAISGYIVGTGQKTACTCQRPVYTSKDSVHLQTRVAPAMRRMQGG